MRVTNRMISDTTYRNANAHLEKMADLQNKLASGKAINKPSDDPTAVNQSMLLSNTLANQDQYVKNLDQVNTWLDSTDSTLNDATTVLQRARVLATQGADGTNTAESRKAIAKEVDQLKEQLRSIGNTQIAGRYIFAGSQTLTAPYPPFNPIGSATAYPSPAPNNIDNTDPMMAEIGPNISMQYNVTGTVAFGATTDPNGAFQVLNDLSNALNANDTTTISNQIDRLDKGIEQVSLARADLGGKRNRSQLLQDRYNNMEISLKDLLSRNQDVDMPAVISQLTLTQSVYQASLSAASKIIQPTLVDFLR